MRNGQVWIETVLYTLIGLSLLGLVLTFVMPKINESKDRAAVEQSINSLNLIDDKINSILQAPGNVRIIEFVLRRGEITISPGGDSIVLRMDELTKPYSEPNVSVSFGSIKIKSEVNQKVNSVNLELNYSGKLNLSYGEGNDDRKFGFASTPYKFSVKSLPVQNGMEQISIEEISGR